MSHHTYREFALGALLGGVAGATAGYLLQTKAGRALKEELLKNLHIDHLMSNGKDHVPAATQTDVRHVAQKIKHKAKRAVKKAAHPASHS